MKSKTLAILVLILLIGAGYLAWQAIQDKNNKTIKTSSQATNTTDNTLKISEWGVKFSLPSKLGVDIYYGIENKNELFDDQMGFEIANLASHSLDNKSNSECSLKSANGQKTGGMGLAIARSKAKVVKSEKAYIRVNIDIGDGNYYHVYQSHASCTSIAQAEQDQTNLIQELIEPISTLTISK